VNPRATASKPCWFARPVSLAALGVVVIAVGGCASGTPTPLGFEVQDAETGAPAAGVTVMVWTPEPFHPLRVPGDYIKGNRPDGLHAQTDALGVAVLMPEVPGPVEAGVMIPGWGRDTVTFDDLPVPPGQPGAVTTWYTFPRSETTGGVPGVRPLRVRFFTPPLPVFRAPTIAP
jgi:hypothetical protein